MKANAALRFSVLGPLLVERDGEPVPIGAERERMLLAVLLLRSGQVVSAGELIERLWGDDLPARPRAALQTYVWRLRGKFGDEPDALATVESGYILKAPWCDLDEFRSLVDCDDRAFEAESLRRALAMCRGPVLPEFSGRGAVDDLIERLEEEILTARQRRIEIDLDAGSGGELVPELQALVAEHPLREVLRGQLMVALYRGGRQSEALGVYRELATLLSEQHGLDPGRPLRELHEAILVNDPALGQPNRRIADPLAGWRIRRQLPLDLPDFVGRRNLIEDLNAHLVSESGSRVPIVGLHGLPGSGKTVLAVRLGHLTAEAFPDGQWFASLGGTADPKDPHTLTGDLLQASGMPGPEIPTDEDARSAALRDRLAGRRVLMILDNAATASQVDSLLPGTAGSAVIVTSRVLLDDLVMRRGARPVAVPELTLDEARELLGRVAGPNPLEGSAEDIEELIRRSGGLPLALRIAGAGIGEGLHVDAAIRSGVRSTLSDAYAARSPELQSVFRLLTRAHTASVTVESTAAMSAVSLECAREALRSLEHAGLVREYRPARYELHDLLREYGSDLGGDEADAALDRLLVWVAATARRAAARLPGNSGGKVPEFASSTVPPVEFDDLESALDWFEAEADDLLALARAAARRRRPAAWWLADAMRDYCYFGGDWRRLTQVAEYGEQTADQIGDAAARARMTRHLGTAAILRGDLDQAAAYDRSALDLAVRAGDAAEQAAALIGLADDYTELGRVHEAVELLERAIDRARAAGDQATAANAGYSLGVSRRRLGELDQAEADLLGARRLAAEAGAVQGEMVCLLELGALGWQRGDLTGARDVLEQARDLATRTFYRLPEIEIHSELALVLAFIGSEGEALRIAERGQELAARSGTESAAVHFATGTAHLRMNDRAKALDHFYRALHLSADGLPRPQARARIGLAAVYLSVGRGELAAQHAERAVEIAERAHLTGEHGLAVTYQAWGHLAAGAVGRAAALAAVAADMNHTSGFGFGQALTSHLRGDIEWEAGRPQEAHRHWKEALARYESMGMVEAETMRDRLADSTDPFRESGAGDHVRRRTR